MAEGGNSVVSITEYSGVLKRWSRVILAMAAVGAVLGTALLATSSGSYVAEALVQVRPIVSQSDDPNLDTSRQISAETEEAIAGSQRVAERALALRIAAAELGTDRMDTEDVIASARQVTVDSEEARNAADQVTVTVVFDSQILSLEATADKPEVAQSLAQSTAVAYLEFRRDQALVGNSESRERLLDREAQLIAELDLLADDVDAVPEGGILAYTDVAKRQELTIIGTKFANLQSLTVDPGVVLTDAAVPTSKEGLPLLAGPVMGALLGLVGALTAVFLIDRNDDRLRSGRIELGALGVPMLGTAPVQRTKRSTFDGSSSRLYPVNTEGSDAYRRLQGSLLFNLDNDNKSVVLVAGVNNPGAGTSVAANIGATAARAGRRTLLVGADLRNDQLGRYLGISEGPGLSDVILSGSSLAESIHAIIGVDNLSLLSAGTMLDRPTDVLQSHAFARLMAAVQADYDLVVVEAPPVLQVADAVDVAGLCDSSVVVAESGSESRQSIAESVDQLRGVGSDIVGVVVADAE